MKRNCALKHKVAGYNGKKVAHTCIYKVQESVYLSTKSIQLVKNVYKTVTQHSQHLCMVV